MPAGARPQMRLSARAEGNEVARTPAVGGCGDSPQALGEMQRDSVRKEHMRIPHLNSGSVAQRTASVKLTE